MKPAARTYLMQAMAGWLLLVWAGAAAAPLKKTGAPDAPMHAHSHLGWAVSVDGDYAAVSAPTEGRDSLFSVGAVYIYRRESTGWQFYQKVVPADPSTMQHFGACLKLRATTLLVGAPEDNGKSGAVYVFCHDGAAWRQRAKITPENPIGLQEFGCAVDMRAGCAVVGSAGSAAEGIATGLVYVYALGPKEWVQTAIISSPAGTENDHFGAALAIVGNERIVVGAPGGGAEPYRAGLVYSFVKINEGWIMEQELRSSCATEQGLFGGAIASSKNRILVGAMQEHTDSIRAGAAYLYSLQAAGGWALEHRFTHDSKREHDYFGNAVALSDQIAVIGSPKDDGPTHNGEIGCAYLYSLKENGWTGDGKIAPEDGGLDDHFAMAVAVADTDIVIGSRLDDEAAHNTGSVYFYNVQQLFPGLVSQLLPADYRLYKSTMNPLSGHMVIAYDLPEPTHVRLTVYDLFGREVVRLVEREELAGRRKVVWNRSDSRGEPLASGMYIYRLQTPGFRAGHTIVVMK